MSKTPYSTMHRLSAGFSLVEIMIGMVIGMLGIIVMMQIFALSEGQKRTTTGGGDAQNNGAIALYGIQHDVRQAGYGFSIGNLLGCNITLPLPTGLPSGTTIPLAPVVINPPGSVVPVGDANTDRLLVTYGNTNGAPQGTVISGVAGAVYTISPPMTFAVGDYVVAVVAAPNTCAANLILTRVTAISAPLTTPRVTVATGVAGAVTLYNLGQAPTILAYAVRGGNLTVCDYAANNFSNNCGLSSNLTNLAIWLPIASNIVSLRAQYGRDSLTPAVATPPNPPPKYVVDTYDQTTPSALTVPPAPCGWSRSPAVRIALTARSGQYDKAFVTTTATAPRWEGSTVVTGSTAGANNPTAVPIILTANSSWQHYRYKLFQTVIPLRNINWMGVQSNC